MQIPLHQTLIFLIAYVLPGCVDRLLVLFVLYRSSIDIKLFFLCVIRAELVLQPVMALLNINLSSSVQHTHIIS